MEILAGRFKTGDYVAGGLKFLPEFSGQLVPEVQVGFRDNKAIFTGIGSQIKFGSLQGSLPGLTTEIVQFTIDSTGKGIIRLDAGVADAGLPLNYILDGDVYMQVDDDTANTGNYTIGAGPYGQANNYGLAGVFHRQNGDRNVISVEPVDAITAESGTITPGRLLSDRATYVIGANDVGGTITGNAGGQALTKLHIKMGETTDEIFLDVADSDLIAEDVLNLTFTSGGTKVTEILYRRPQKPTPPFGTARGYKGASKLLREALEIAYIGSGTEEAPVPTALAFDIHAIPNTPVYTPTP